MNACETWRLKAIISLASQGKGLTLALVWLLFQRSYFRFGIYRFEMPSAVFVSIEKAFSSQTLRSPKSFLKAAAACLIPSLFSVLSETDAASYAVILLH